MLKLVFILPIFALMHFTQEKEGAVQSNHDGHPSCQTKFDSFSKRIIYTTVDVEPENIGGRSFLLKQLQQIKLDSIPPNYDTQFTVAFIIEENGKVTNSRIIKDKTGGQFGKRMLEIIKANTWVSGICKGKKAATYKEISIRICLSEE